MDNSIEKRGIELTSFDLKTIAIICMLIDHTAAVLLYQSAGYEVLRLIGRLAFPIFCFLLTQGFIYTKNVWKYMARLAVFAIISEIPFDLAFYKKPFAAEHQNVFFTLTLGLVAVTAAGKGAKWFISYICKGFSLDESKADSPVLQCIAALPAVILCAYLASSVFFCDYGAQGVLMMFVLYMFSQHKFMAFVALVIVNSLLCINVDELLYTGNIVLYDTVQWWAPLAFVPILFYKGNVGRKGMKYLFYAFYPLHLLILYFVSLI